MPALLKNIYTRFAVVLILFASAFAIDESSLFETRPDTVARRIEKALWQKERQIAEEIEIVSTQCPNSKVHFFSALNTPHLYELAGNHDLHIFIYRNDTLAFWPSNALPLEFTNPELNLDRRFLKLDNAWCEVIRKEAGNCDIIGIIPVKNDFAYENKYLQNAFRLDFLGSNSVGLAGKESPDATIIYASDGAPLFSVSLVKNPDELNIKLLIVNLLNIMALLLFVATIRKIGSSIRSKHGQALSALFFCLCLVAARSCMLVFKLPPTFYELPLFSPEHYAASSASPSLGDLFINALLILFCVYEIWEHLNPGIAFSAFKPRRKVYVLNSLLFCLIYGFAVFTETQIQGLVEDSNIPFEVNSLFALNLYSYVGIIITCMLLLAIFFIADKSIEIIKHISQSRKQVAFGFALATSLYTLHTIFENNPEVLHLIWPVSVIIVVFFAKRVREQYSFTNVVLIIGLFAALASMFFTGFTSQKERINRKVITQRLSNNEDPLLEISFRAMKDRLKNDQDLRKFLTPGIRGHNDSLDAYIKQKYFKGYLSRFEVKTYCNFSTDTSGFKDGQADGAAHYKRLLATYGKPVSGGNLYFIDKPGNNAVYLAVFPLLEPVFNTAEGEVFILISSRIFDDQLGFPDLLIEGNDTRNELFNDYSYAIYSNAQLIKQHGSFPYGYSAGNWLEGVDNEGFVNYDGYSHYVAHTDSETTVILSKPLLDFSSAITAFSYLFAFYSVILLIFILARNIVLKQGIRSFNINSKIQLLLVLIILASTVLFGLGTSYFIKRQYDEKNNKNISERMRSVLIEVKHKLGENKGLRDVSSEYLSGILNKFSNVFFTDINLYDLSGKLVASSRIEIFDRNLISNMMDPAAYQSIKYSFKNSFVHEESIGNLHYLSAYAPFTNQAGQIMGYINLPYFARQGEMEKEISSFLVALINIYVFLFALSVIAALLISGFVTSPLRKIQNMLSNIELGKSNRQISYDKKDEIGQLVTVYNKKVLELQKSVELLAKSERESAWRDMAKQVAHEIKNPLTPMRLSVQHLLRTIKDNPASAKEQIDKFSENIIGQIDTLSHIADEFSHFAKMPSASFDEMDFNLVLSSAISLFKDADNTRIELNKTNEPLLVKGDKEQLNRVIINLLKNAFQSIPTGRKGLIRINIREGSKSDFILSVADNGVGIPDEQKGKIFTPNFTTKSTGMGMGLVMVKSIVENHRGNIWFDSTPDKGTTFYISLPKLQK